jgi:hypothetical protein
VPLAVEERMLRWRGSSTSNGDGGTSMWRSMRYSLALDQKNMSADVLRHGLGTGSRTGLCTQWAFESQ